MKKRLLLLFVVLFGMTACKKECPKCECDKCPEYNFPVEVVYEEKEKELKQILLDYGKKVYENDRWLNGNIEPSIYYMNLLDLETQKYDTSMFVNPVTGTRCDEQETKVEFVVREKTDKKTKYEFRVRLKCYFD